MAQPYWSETNRAAVVGIRPYYEGNNVIALYSGVGNATVAVVPSGKLWLLLNASIQVLASTAGTLGTAFIRWQDSGLAAKYSLMNINRVGEESEVSTHNFFYPLELAAGWHIRVTGTYYTWYVSLNYIEVSV
jgi:hypothetical protein